MQSSQKRCVVAERSITASYRNRRRSKAVSHKVSTELTPRSGIHGAVPHLLHTSALLGAQ
jgi:hypothetical protein